MDEGIYALNAECEAMQNEIERLEAENAKLREKIKALTELASIGKLTASQCTELAEDNAKLRELVADMWRFTGTACKKYPRLFDPAAQGGQMVQLNMIEAFEQRMRELGVEVDE